MFESGKWSCDRKAKTVEYDAKYEHEGYGGGTEDVKVVFAEDEDEGTSQTTQFYVDGVLLEEAYANVLTHVVFQIDDLDIDKQWSLNDLAHIASLWFGTLEDYPAITVYEAYDAFFTSGKWSFDGFRTVAFSGEYDDGEYVYDITLECWEQFDQDGGFSFESIAVDGTDYGSDAASIAIDEIFGSYDSSVAA